jgi:hypothetical protein
MITSANAIDKIFFIRFSIFFFLFIQVSQSQKFTGTKKASPILVEAFIILDNLSGSRSFWAYDRIAAKPIAVGKDEVVAV